MTIAHEGMQELVEKLGQTVADADETCHEDTDPVWLGPDFALTVGDLRGLHARILSLAAELERVREALREIADWRKGSPQPASMNWQRIAEAMQANARAALQPTVGLPE